MNLPRGSEVRQESRSFMEKKNEKLLLPKRCAEVAQVKPGFFFLDAASRQRPGFTRATVLRHAQRAQDFLPDRFRAPVGRGFCLSYRFCCAWLARVSGSFRTVTLQPDDVSTRSAAPSYSAASVALGKCSRSLILLSDVQGCLCPRQPTAAAPNTPGIAEKKFFDSLFSKKNRILNNLSSATLNLS